MTLLIIGLLVWTAAHYFKRLAPGAHEKAGRPGKWAALVVILGALALMITGYQQAAFIPVWTPPAFMVHIANTLMLIAFWVYSSGAVPGAKAWPAYKTRHPQLAGFKIWALAHLLVNGDLASILLFGGLLGWAVAQLILINKAEPGWTPPEPGGAMANVKIAVVTVVLYGVVSYLHIWLGVYPFPV
jgi:uncharacterized membrane protein